jgi:hypothetical protein
VFRAYAVIEAFIVPRMFGVFSGDDVTDARRQLWLEEGWRGG